MNWKKRYDKKFRGKHIDMVTIDESSGIDFASMYPRFMELLNEMGTQLTRESRIFTAGTTRSIVDINRETIEQLHRSINETHVMYTNTDSVFSSIE